MVKVNSSQENLKETFLILQKYYEELLQLPIDKSGKDVTRLCFVSYDTYLYLNENAEIYPVISIEDLRPYMEQYNESFTTEPINNDYLAVYEHCITFTEKKESYINDNRNNFVHLLANNLNLKGVSFAVATGYILSDYVYNASEVMGMVKSAYSNTSEHSKNNNPITPKSENKKAKNEDTEEEEKPSYIDRLETFLDYRYNFRYNIVTGKLEYKTIKANLWKPITDFVENSILREILKAKVKCNINTSRNLLNSDYCQQYDQFRDYFQDLETNNDEVDYINPLANTVLTTKQEL